VRGIPAMLAQAGFQVLRDGVSHDGPGEADFTPADWAVLQQAIMAAGVLVALAEGTADADEIYALVRTLREAGVSHPRRLIRELASSSTFETTLHPGAEYEDYQGPALEAIRSATAILARRAPAELPAFRGLLAQITAIVADANNEGGFFGLGARPRTPAETAAMKAVTKATEPGS
jgi:hypothetical protein